MANHIALQESIHGKAFLHRASGTGLNQMFDDMQASDAREQATRPDNTEPLKQPPDFALMMVGPMPMNGIRMDGEETGCRERNPSHGNDDMS